MIQQNKYGVCYSKGKRLDRHIIETIRNHVKSGLSVTDIQKKVKLSYNTVAKYHHLCSTNQQLPKLGRPCEDTLLSSSSFIRFLFFVTATNPLLTHNSIRRIIQQEIGISVSSSYVGKMRRKVCKLRRKRLALIALQRKSLRVQLLRRSFRRTVQQVPLQFMYYLDESHFDHRDIVSGYGYFPVSEKPNWTKNFYQRRSYSLLAMHGFNNLVYYELIDTTNNGVNEYLFLMFLRNALSRIPGGSVVLLDNARVHRTPGTSLLFESYGITPLFNAPYSPDYNPIELMFGWVKNRIRESSVTTGFKLLDAVRDTLISVPSRVLENNVRHCVMLWKEEEPIVPNIGE